MSTSAALANRDHQEGPARLARMATQVLQETMALQVPLATMPTQGIPSSAPLSTSAHAKLLADPQDPRAHQDSQATQVTTETQATMVAQDSPEARDHQAHQAAQETQDRRAHQDPLASSATDPRLHQAPRDHQAVQAPEALRDSQETQASQETTDSQDPQAIQASQATPASPASQETQDHRDSLVQRAAATSAHPPVLPPAIKQPRKRDALCCRKSEIENLDAITVRRSDLVDIVVECSSV